MPLPLPREFTVPLHAPPSPAPPASTPCTVAALLARRRGLPYTTVVTVRGARAVPMLPFHARRLLTGMAALLPAHPPPEPREFAATVLRVVAHIVRGRRVPGELQLVVIVFVEAGVPRVGVHASDIADPVRNVPLVDVEVRGRPRRSPAVKDTAWAAERRALEDARAEGMAETVLVGKDENGCYSLFEGLVSNVFVLTQNCDIYTAPADRVLPGSLRDCVLAACDDLGVRVVERPIRLAEYRAFGSAFLTNARRYLHPIRSLCVAEPEVADACPRKIQLPHPPETSELVDKLRVLVCQRLERCATPILSPTE